MIHIPLMDIDFIKWQSCTSDSNCISGWSNRPTTFLVDLPEGIQKIQVQLCLRADHSTTRVEACSDWGKAIAYTQKPRTNPVLQKWMNEQDQITLSFNTLGSNLHTAMGQFLNEASQCSDSDSNIIQTIKSAMSYGEFK